MTIHQPNTRGVREKAWEWHSKKNKCICGQPTGSSSYCPDCQSKLDKIDGRSDDTNETN